MVVGTLRLYLVIREARSLKDRRRVLNSLKDRLRNQFNISIAEVDGHTSHQVATLGVAIVTNEVRHAQQVLSQIESLVRAHPIAVVTRAETEIL